MPLESLNDNQINIHDLTLEQEKQPISEWQKQYEDLKETPLYDPENGEWNCSMDERGVTETRLACSQLVGTLIESFSDKTKAEKIYKRLQKTNLYIGSNCWHKSIGTDRKTRDEESTYFNLYFSLLVENQFDPTKAKEKYLQRKNSDQTINDFSVLPQLTNLLLESKLNLLSPSEGYAELLKSDLYENETGYFYEDKINDDTVRSTEQLMGVLVLAQFDKPKAIEKYMLLKKSPIYDSENQQWFWIYDERQNMVVKDIYSTEQLLGILCEHELEEQKPDLESLTPALPEQRSY